MIIPAWPCGQPKPQPNHGADHSPRAVSARSEITAQITHPITAPTRRLAPRRSFGLGCDLGCDLAVIAKWEAPCLALRAAQITVQITAPEPCPPSPKSQHRPNHSQSTADLLVIWPCGRPKSQPPSRVRGVRNRRTAHENHRTTTGKAQNNHRKIIGYSQENHRKITG